MLDLRGGLLVVSKCDLSIIAGLVLNFLSGADIRNRVLYLCSLLLLGLLSFEIGKRKHCFENGLWEH